MLIVMLLCGNTKGDKQMKTDYVFGDRVKVLPKLDETVGYADKLNVGEISCVLNGEDND